MCGIVGIYRAKTNCQEKLLEALGRISHRGSQQNEYAVFPTAGIGANRLPIVGPSNGRQPKFNENRNLAAVLNGEIFNFKKLNESLQSQGQRIEGNCDTETLVHLYERYGSDCVQYIDSEMFAFIIYDSKNNLLFAARDPLGVKPLYYATGHDGAFYLASEIKALTQFPDVLEIFEFPAGHFYQNGKFERYHLRATQALQQVDFDSTKTLIETALIKAVRKRLPLNQPVAVLLSGGVDSSLVAAIANAYHNDVTCFILGTEESEDRHYAERLCLEMNWKYEIVSADIDYEQELPEIIYYAESFEPNIIRHSFASNAVCRQIRARGYNIALTGEGADELFAGYNEFKSFPVDKINRGCELLLHSMSNGNLMRVDKMAMRHTVEMRCPFFDAALVDLGLSIAGEQKVFHDNGRIVTKHILREAARKFLPGYIADREKLPFANGAGMDIGNNFTQSDGVLSQLAERLISDEGFAHIQKNHSSLGLRTKEDALYFSYYEKFGYDKFCNLSRPVMKDTLLEAVIAEG